MQKYAKKSGHLYNENLPTFLRNRNFFSQVGFTFLAPDAKPLDSHIPTAHVWKALDLRIPKRPDF